MKHNPENQYKPWIAEGLTEVEYWKKLYLEARMELHAIRPDLPSEGDTLPFVYRKWKQGFAFTYQVSYNIDGTLSLSEKYEQQSFKEISLLSSHMVAQLLNIPLRLDVTHLVGASPANTPEKLDKPKCKCFMSNCPECNPFVPVNADREYMFKGDKYEWHKGIWRGDGDGNILHERMCQYIKSGEATEIE